MKGVVEFVIQEIGGDEGDRWRCRRLFYVIVRLSLLRKTILNPEYKAFMCVCVFVDGCISQV